MQSGLVKDQDVPTHLSEFLHGIPRHKTDFNLTFFFDRQRKREVTERVELDGNFTALWAHDCRLEQTVEDVDNDRVVPLYVIGPCLFCHFLHVSTVISMMIH